MMRCQACWKSTFEGAAAAGRNDNESGNLPLKAVHSEVWGVSRILERQSPGMAEMMLAARLKTYRYCSV